MKQGWEIKKLGEVCEIQGGSTPKRTESSFWDNGTYPWFTIEDIREQGHIILDTKQKITKVAWDKMRIFPKDTILLCCTASLGEYAITQIPLSSNQQFNGLMIKDRNYLSPMYLMHYCSTLKNTLLSLSGKATIDFVSAEKVRQIPISIPPLAVQEKIVAELDCLSGIIEKKKQQLKELDALAESIFYTMFGDPITNEKGWKVKKLGDIGKVITGNTPSTKDEENYSSKDYCFVKPSDIGKDYVTNIEKTEFYISEKAFFQSRKLCIGSVLTTCIGIIGKVGVLKVDATCNQQINAILPNDNYISEYIAWAIYLIKGVIEDIANAPVVPIINKGEFSNIMIPIPPIELQQEFASKIEAIEKQKALIKQSITETEELFNSRMDYYFG